MAVFKPDGAVLVPTDLDTMKDLSAAAVIILEENVRLLQSDRRFTGGPRTANWDGTSCPSWTRKKQLRRKRTPPS